MWKRFFFLHLSTLIQYRVPYFNFAVLYVNNAKAGKASKQTRQISLDYDTADGWLIKEMGG
jgi:hypothetical protein